MVPPSSDQAESAAVPQRFALWSCNVQPWRHWLNVQTMWATDGGWRCGLRVADVQAYMELSGVADGEREALYALLQECELEALTVYAEHWQADEQERALEREREKQRDKLRK
nr:DUF1799 domain-containing protein [Comamonas testosteroni]